MNKSSYHINSEKKNLSSFLCLLLIVFPWVTNSQPLLDVTGTWVGTIEVPLSPSLNATYQLVQTGNNISGDLKMVSQNGNDSTKYKVEGTIKNGLVSIEGTEFEYKSIGACLAKTELKLAKIGDMDQLGGKWSGDFRFSTCPPGISGKVQVYRVPPIQDATLFTRNVVVVANDFEGTALIDELKKRTYYALIIGINNYNDPAITDLENPIQDAQELTKTLHQHYSFENDNIFQLNDPTRTEIIEAFDAINEKVSSRDQLLIFYAGHGIWDKRLNQGFWLPSDALLTSKAQWLSNSTIRDYIGGIPSKHTLLITDACFSGGIFKERAITFENSKAILEMYKLPSRKAMTSGALKTVPDNSVFIKYLIKNLITNDQPLLAAEELFGSFKMAVINNSPNGQVPQYGAIGQVGDEGGDFIFMRRVKE